MEPKSFASKQRIYRPYRKKTIYATNVQIILGKKSIYGYAKEKVQIVIFICNVYIFVWIQHSCVANMYFLLLILVITKRLWCIWPIPTCILHSSELWLYIGHIFAYAGEDLKPAISIITFWSTFYASLNFLIAKQKNTSTHVMPHVMPLMGPCWPSCYFRSSLIKAYRVILRDLCPSI